MTDEKDTVIEFPCDFPIKVIGNNTDSFVHDITSLAQKHFPDLKEDKIKTKKSDGNNYISITLTIRAKDKPSLDNLYQALTKQKDVKMVL